MARTKGATNKPRPSLNGKPCAMAFLFRCMADESLDMRERIDCAKAIMPYQHRKLPVAIDHQGEVGISLGGFIFKVRDSDAADSRD